MGSSGGEGTGGDEAVAQIALQDLADRAARQLVDHLEEGDALGLAESLVGPGASIDAEAVRAWANERLGKTQRIAFLEVVDELPRSSRFRTLPIALRDRFLATRSI